MWAKQSVQCTCRQWLPAWVPSQLGRLCTEAAGAPPKEPSFSIRQQQTAERGSNWVTASATGTATVAVTHMGSMHTISSPGLSRPSMQDAIPSWAPAAVAAQTVVSWRDISFLFSLFRCFYFLYFLCPRTHIRPAPCLQHLKVQVHAASSLCVSFPREQARHALPAAPPPPAHAMHQ